MQLTINSIGDNFQNVRDTVFVSAYSKVVERLSNKSTNSSSVEDRAQKERPVPLIG